MDFITHSLIGAGIARLATPRRDWQQQLALAGVLGSLVMDADAAFALGGLNFYGKYHRVVTHSLVGLEVCALLAAVAAWVAGRREGWRRFGWFVADRLPGDSPPPTPVSFAACLGVAWIAAHAHWVADWITAFGNLQPLWPWDTREVALGATNSFDVFLLVLTCAWHGVLRWKNLPREREWPISLGWLLIAAGYVTWRAVFGPHGVA